MSKVIDLNYCYFCKTSHDRGKYHVYSKRHKAVINSILIKFLRKIQQVVKQSRTPEVFDKSWEEDAKFWCYFCAKDLPRHLMTERMCVKNQAFLLHFISSLHHNNTHKFWWDHRLPKDQINSYILESEIYDRFCRKLEDVKKAFITKTEEKRIAVVQRMKNVDAERKLLLESEKQLNEYWINNLWKPIPSTVTMTQPLNRTQDVEYSGTGVTYVGRQSSSDVGNVHTGATPPWLTKTDGDSSGKVIGPTIDNYQKHLKRETKRKLNPNRVGANFDHTSETSSDWLPSFGRVWNMGRRWQSRHEFRREEKRGKGKTRIVAADVRRKSDAIKKTAVIKWRSSFNSDVRPQSSFSDTSPIGIDSKSINDAVSFHEVDGVSLNTGLCQQPSRSIDFDVNSDVTNSNRAGSSSRLSTLDALAIGSWSKKNYPERTTS